MNISLSQSYTFMILKDSTPKSLTTYPTFMLEFDFCLMTEKQLSEFKNYLEFTVKKINQNCGADTF